ncbi:tryptophan 2,3-dioxygenase family protein [Winogradskyella endarachnes]|uniref:Tryptophan 2,3-dioxygenase n=1 Tax=Winogradskyella endarachnes TaxID=2681965 RepID=A0A6L6U936_9FLAO|nr:tryptophan 2,3-dioxygenase family protein [Winogradskyella endarachnes]MUU78539.1 tryptophan 2,3-dioxygenase [Winogradskyella endarachnes]
MAEQANYDDIIKELQEKYTKIDQDTDDHLYGLLYSKPITYWDYIQTDALLNLQIQRTTLPDEMVFIAYHQINELIFKMILWEISQVAEKEDIEVTFFESKLMRISRYFDMLSTSFNIMREGMEVEQYMKFRYTLTPASGFQSAQYRLIEFASTELINLIDYRFRKDIDRDTPFTHAFEHLYWQAAGKDHKTGKKSTLLINFEKRYKDEFLRFMKNYNTKNLWTRFKELPEEDQKDKELISAMRHYDYTVNVSWVMAHYNAAVHYIESGIGDGEATGGSDWKKYMHPKYQKRIFFPELWSAEEIKNWGNNL